MLHKYNKLFLSERKGYKMKGKISLYEPITFKCLELFDIHLEMPSDVIEVYPSHHDERKNTAHYHMAPHEDSKDVGVTDIIHQIRILLKPDGSVWSEAVEYLIFKYEETGEVTTANNHSDALRYYMNWCAEQPKPLDYLEAKSKLRLPLLKYRKAQMKLIREEQLSPSTLKTRLGCLVQFYKFLEDELGYHFKVPPYGKEVEYRTVIDGGAGVFIKSGKTTEVNRVAGSKRQTSDEIALDGQILDGGERLRPLDETELRILSKALKELAHTEFTLAHQIIQTTGARTQTIFTLRQCHFDRIPHSSETKIEIKAGGVDSPLIDTKSNNVFMIRIPVQVYLSIRTYIRSERAQGQYERAKHKFADPKEQYVFLSSQGNPFYHAKSDPFRVLFRNPAKGTALATFINKTLKPKLEELGFKNPYYNYKFHNNRATFGLARLHTNLSAIDHEQPMGKQIDQAYSRTVRDMNHSNLATTLRYVSYEKDSKLKSEVQSDWENYLQNVAGL